MDPAATARRSAYEPIFGLLALLDDGHPFLSFLDEGGSFAVGVHWAGVLPPGWFRCVAATADPESYAAAVSSACGLLAWADWERLRPEAMAVADADQRAALDRRGPIARSSQLRLPG